MADHTEAWVDEIAITLRSARGQKQMMVSGQTYSAEGLPIRGYGPTDIYGQLTTAQKTQFESWVTQAIDIIQEAYQISDSDLLPEAPPDPMAQPMAEMIARAGGAQLEDKPEPAPRARARRR